MKTSNRLKHLFSSPQAFFSALIKRSLVYKYVLSDKQAIQLMYWHVLRKKVNLNNPTSFNDKMQWLKLYNHKALYTTMADKYAAKEYAASIIGEQYIVPSFGKWNNAQEIDWDSLPNQFVLKCNHGYGGLTGIVICKDKTKLDKQDVVRRLNKSLKRNYFYTGREWPYKNIKPCIFAERYLGENLQDFRVYCFNGKPRLVYSYTNVAQKDGSKPELSSCDIFDCEWKAMPYHQHTLPCGRVERPKHLTEMLEIATKLSKDIPFLRVDFFETDQLYLGELTFYPGGGMSKYYPAEWDEILGSWTDLPKEINL